MLQLRFATCVPGEFLEHRDAGLGFQIRQIGMDLGPLGSLSGEFRCSIYEVPRRQLRSLFRGAGVFRHGQQIENVLGRLSHFHRSR